MPSGCHDTTKILCPGKLCEDVSLFRQLSSAQTVQTIHSRVRRHQIMLERMLRRLHIHALPIIC